MPTASTAQILGNNEAIEPYTSNIYTRRVLSGEFQIVNYHLLKDLTERGELDILNLISMYMLIELHILIVLELVYVKIVNASIC